MARPRRRADRHRLRPQRADTERKRFAPAARLSGADMAPEPFSGEANDAKRFGESGNSAGMLPQPFSANALMQGLAGSVATALRAQGLDELRIGRVIKTVAHGVARELGGLKVYVPKGNRVGAEKAEHAAQLKRQGLSTVDIATRMQLSERRVQQLLRTAAERHSGR